MERWWKELGGLCCWSSMTRSQPLLLADSMEDGSEPNEGVLGCAARERGGSSRKWRGGGDSGDER